MDTTAPAFRSDLIISRIDPEILLTNPAPGRMVVGRLMELMTSPAIHASL